MRIAAPEDPVNTLHEEIEKAFQSHHARMLRLAWRVTGNATDAEDALQTVFLRLLRRDDWQPQAASLEAYLNRAAVNAALDIVRARKESEPVEAVESNGSAAPVAGQPESFYSGELPEFLRRSLAALSPQAAEIFTLRFFDDYRNSEIAEMLGISVVKVAVVLHRARGKLKKEITRRCGPRKGRL
ncbi:MAG: RNA polymerase sigma factor [Terriglobia bacterium]